MTLSDDQAAVNCSAAHTSQQQATTSGIPAIEVSRLRLDLWAVATEAMFLSWNTAPLSEEEVTYLSAQVGDLLRFLARRHIYPLDQTSEAITGDDRQTPTSLRKETSR